LSSHGHRCCAQPTNETRASEASKAAADRDM
jgi:hypothetical protein